MSHGTPRHRRLRVHRIELRAAHPAGAARLAGHEHLHQLFLGGPQITDAGLDHIKDLNLEWLALIKTSVTDEGLAMLKNFEKLVLLRIESTQLSDAGLEHIGQQQGLRELWIINAPVTDAGLEHLKGLSQVRSLLLRGTKITDAGLADLKAALPMGGVHR